MFRCPICGGDLVTDRALTGQGSQTEAVLRCLACRCSPYEPRRPDPRPGESRRGRSDPRGARLDKPARRRQVG